MRVHASIEPLDWESRFFGVRSARLCFADQAPALSEEQLADYARVQAKIPAHCHHWLDALQALQFRLVESECDFLLPVAAQPADAGIRIATATDIPLLRTMAASAFAHSRFRAPWYADTDSGRFYACWVENAVLGSFDHQCLLLRDADNVCQGFVTLRQLNADSARIGLLAGRGAGARLIGAAQHWCARRHIGQLYVATQAANLAAMRRYIKSGGLIHSTAYWLYR